MREWRDSVSSEQPDVNPEQPDARTGRQGGDRTSVDAAEAQVAPVTLPADFPLRRNHIVPADERGPGFDDTYDFHTLIYDAVHLPDEGRVALFAPKLLNLETVFRCGDIRLDGRSARPSWIVRHRRYDVVLLPAGGPPTHLSLAYSGWSGSVTFPPAEAEAFAGRNCLLTMSRDNPLRWIRDWAAYHVREHGADAALFYDNGSQDYGPADLLRALSEVEGLAVVRVVSVTAPYGAFPARGSRSRALFLQTAMWNVARTRFLRDARAVLPCDIDELVTRRGDRSVFDAAVGSWGGYVKFRGAWRTHRLDPGQQPLHRDHVWLPERPSGCPTKYCVVPSGWLRRNSWNTHNLAWVPFSRAFESDEFAYLHCHGISTHWKSAGSRRSLLAGAFDAPTEGLMHRHFADDAALTAPES